MMVSINPFVVHSLDFAEYGSGDGERHVLPVTSNFEPHHRVVKLHFHLPKWCNLSLSNDSGLTAMRREIQSKRIATALPV